MDAVKVAHDEAEDAETTGILRWRFGQLCRAGFEHEDAALVAARLDVDLHQALALVERGCPPKTAVRILA
jgi:hypothetical protein